MEERIISSCLKGEDFSYETTCALQAAEFIGQENLKEKLTIYITAARERGESLDHVLLFTVRGAGENHPGSNYFQGNGG